MSFDIQRIQKSTRKVRQFLRKNSRRPGAGAIHNLRTSARRLRTHYKTLGLNSKRRVRRMLRSLRIIRKQAGTIRDMDVLTGHTLTLQQPGEQDCLGQLREYLGAKRNIFAKKLELVIDETGGQLGQDLKRNFKVPEKLLDRRDTGDSSTPDAVQVVMAKAIRLSVDLRAPATLNENNLHRYCPKVKKLRDVLQLSAEAD